MGGLIDTQRADWPLVWSGLPIDSHPSQVESVSVLGVVLHSYKKDCQQWSASKQHKSEKWQQVGAYMAGASNVRAPFVRGHPVILKQEIAHKVCRDEIGY